MKAIVQDVYGSADVLELRDIDKPAIGDDGVLVEVRAAAVDVGVWVLMTGQPRLMRFVGFGLTRPKVPVRGRDVAGVVAAVGPKVTRFRPGDEVYGTCRTGSYAEFAGTREKFLAHKPANLTFDQAAAVPVSGMTALEATRRVREGDRVMVTGATGGVGSYTVQLAKLRGAAAVTAVCSTGNADFARSLGADDVIDYTREEVDRDGGVYDVIIDIGGNRPLSVLRRALTPRGTILLVGGGHAVEPVLGGMGRALRAPLLSLFIRQNLRPVTGRERAEYLNELTTLLEAGKLTPAIDRTYTLAEAPDALRRLTEGHPAGKLVITV
jgi:NADPH:quinone reductase-like Zn-dependent oxidoreductase